MPRPPLLFYGCSCFALFCSSLSSYIGKPTQLGIPSHGIRVKSFRQLPCLAPRIPAYISGPPLHCPANLSMPSYSTGKSSSASSSSYAHNQQLVRSSSAIINITQSPSLPTRALRSATYAPISDACDASSAPAHTHPQCHHHPCSYSTQTMGPAVNKRKLRRYEYAPLPPVTCPGASTRGSLYGCCTRSSRTRRRSVRCISTRSLLSGGPLLQKCVQNDQDSSPLTHSLFVMLVGASGDARHLQITF
ncbi:hypothetical protein J3F83DRAFT_636588 [Trichoderma novae-zelandiae]